MDEITEYREQIKQINGVLESEGLTGNEKEEMEQTKKDLEELIGLMEEELSESVPSTSECKEDNDEDEDVLDLDELLGVRIMAPYDLDKTVSSHSSIIMEIEASTTLEQTMARVLFSHPTCPAMRPCPHFLKSKCRFSQDCRFSHGHLVQMSRLEEYVEPDFSSIQKDSVVLIKNSLELWELGKITAVDGQQIAVNILKTGKEIASTFENVVPVIDQPVKELDTSWSELKMNSLGNVNNGDIGKWEGGGIGMKLMMKMGYKVGQGLGKQSDGIVHAIQPKICPKNASVDECMLKKRKVVDGKTDEKKRKKRKLDTSKVKQEAERDIFAFINKKLEQNSSEKTFQQIKEENKQISGSSSESLGIKGIDLELELKSLKVKQKKLKEGIQRNKNDRTTANKLEESLKDVEAKISKMEQKQNRVQSEINSRNRKKKDIF